MRRYDGSIAVVTGASSGIGRQIATDLASRGASVIGIARRADLLATLREDLEVFSSNNDVVVCNVADADEFARVLADVERRCGRVDVLINNAGIEQPTPVTQGSPDLRPYRDIMATNYFATVAGTLAILPGMLQRGTGVIANVSSDVARAPEPCESAYAASKAAVSAFTESVAHEVADRGVRLHVVYPAWVPTAMGMSGITSDDPLPPKPVRRTVQQVSVYVLDRLGNERIEINLAWLPLLAPIGRTLAPKLYQRGVRKATARR